MRRAVSFAATALILVACGGPATSPAAREGTLLASEAVDALCLFDALADVPPYAAEYAKERAAWEARLAKVSGAREAVRPWLGDAAFLLHVYAGSADDLEGLIAVVRGPIPHAERVRESEYRARLPDLQRRRGELAAALEALAAAGFAETWRAEPRSSIEASLPALRASLARIPEDRAEAALRPYLGDAAPRSGDVFVAHFGRPFAMSLPGGGAVVPDATDADGLAALLLHERLHAIDLPAAALEAYRDLARDPWVAKGREVLTRGFHESDEEEVVIAAELAVSVRLGLLTRPRALRKAATTMGGVPVAAVLYAELEARPPADAADFAPRVAATLRGLLDRGDLAPRYAALVAPVAGTVGMRVEVRGGAAVLLDVAEGGPAGAAGLRAGDAIVAIDGAPAPRTLPETMDRLVGPAGTPLRITARRGDETLERTLVRGRLSTLPPAPPA